ncbi:MAG: GAF domain-containing protein, partial [Chloroflexi bacterium]|nr:GAF domain-containing protein [Chloroflexota bacterium]
NQIQISQLQQQVNQLNTYMTVSSMLAQPLGLHDMLEAALYCCMDATSAQAASVLLLGENQENFHFYQVAGPAKPVLDAATFPIGEGIAGSVLHSQASEVINDVQEDSRFYGKFDSKSEFQTLNMIAIPLTADEEKVGVLEVINKIDGLDFTEDERLSLMMIAEEIAFAIHNARIFEYVVNSYCLIRQGQHSCRGCERPLGSWTPCVRYRENITVLNMKSPLEE